MGLFDKASWLGGGNATTAEEEQITVGRWEYYEILGAGKDVTLDELRKKRKRLALRYHPDKNQGDDTAQQKMQEVNRAFEVLSDPMKKKLYDKYGIDALTLYENRTITEDMWNFIFILVNRKFTTFVGCACFSLFSLILLSPILIGLKLDGSISLSWIFVLFPVIVIEILVLLLELFVVIIGTYFRETEEQPSEQPSGDAFLHEDKTQVQKISWKQVLKGLLNLLVIILVIIFTLLLCSQLDGYLEWSWWTIFFPLISSELLFTALQLPSTSYKEYEEREISENEQFPRFYCKLQYPGYLLRNYYKEIIVIFFTTLVAMNLQYSSNNDDVEEGEGVSGYISWWYITFPMFILAGVCFLLSIIENCCHEKLKRKDYVPLEQKEEEEGSETCAHGVSICCSCLCVSFIITFFIMLSGWLQEDFEFSAMTMLSPLIFVCALVYCVCTCCVFPLYTYLVHGYLKSDEFELPEKDEPGEN